VQRARNPAAPAGAAAVVHSTVQGRERFPRIPVRQYPAQTTDLQRPRRRLCASKQCHGRDMSQPSAPSSRMRRRVELFENPLPQSLDCRPRAARDPAEKRFPWTEAAHGGVPVSLMRTLAPHIKVRDADSAVGQASWLTVSPAVLATRANTVFDSFEIAKYFWTDSSPTVGTYVAKPETAGRALARSTVRTEVCWSR